MFSKSEESELKRLQFENFLWIVFIFLAIANIVADDYQQDFIKTKDKTYQLSANKIFEFTLIISFLIYIYYLIRNYDFYKKIPENKKADYFIKLLGSILILVGALCFIYFQFKDDYFEGTPAI